MTTADDKASASTPTRALAAELPKIRKRTGATADELALRVRAAGGKLDRAAISKIENGLRDVSLDEAITLAYTLGISPLHLFVPRDDDAMVEVVPAYSTTAAAVRRWIRGTEQLPKLDDRIFRTEVPESEWKATNTRYAEAQQEVDAAHHRWRVAREMAKVITDELAELDRQHPSSPHDRMSAAIGYVTPTDQQRRRLETRLEVAYDRIAEAKVEAEDASNRLWAIRQAMSQGPDGD